MIVLLVVTVLAMVGFVAVERRAGASALIPGDVIGNRDFRAACVVVPMFAMAFFTLLVYLPQFFTKLLDDSALEAGVGLLPFMATFAVVSFVSGSLYERFGAKVILSTGAAFQLAGLTLLAFIDESWGYAQVVPGMFVLGIGVGLFISTVTTAAVTALDESRASLGGAILYMFQVAGGSVGLGISTSVFASAANSKLDSDASAAGLSLSGGEIRDVQGILAGTDTAQQVARQFPGQARDITGLVSDALIAGLQSVLIVCAVVAAIGVIVTILFVGGRLRLSGARVRAEEPAS